jgi:O-antigen/teichoic acid export membrane protein
MSCTLQTRGHAEGKPLNRLVPEANLATIKTVAARVLTMAVGLICGLLTTRLVISSTGVDNFALFSFLIVLPALIPFSDLGTGAALVNRIAQSSAPIGDQAVRDTLLSVLRILVGSAVVLELINIGLFLSGSWDVILGSAGNAPQAANVAFLCASLFAFGVPLSIGSRALLGLGRAHFIVLAQGVQAPLTLLLVWMVIHLEAAQLRSYLAAASYLAALATASLITWLAVGHLRSSFGWTVRNLPRLSSVHGAKVMHIGLPFLVQTVATPLATQLDRIILAQVVSAAELASYSLGSQVFIACYSLFAAAGLTLWPYFAKQRSQGIASRPFAIAGLFAALAFVLGSIIFFLGPPLFDALSAGRVAVSTPVLVAFAAVLVVQAALYPLGMYLMDPKGVRFQTIPVLLMVVSNVLLSIVLARVFGIIGPLIATAVTVSVFQLVPFAVYVSRRRV